MVETKLYYSLIGDLQGVGDDTALNAVELDCYNSEDEKVRTISSSQGDFGEWGHHSYCSDRQVLTGISFRSERVRQIFLK